MKIIEVKKTEVDYKDYIRRTATRKDFGELIREPCIVVCEGKIKLIYDILNIDTSRVVLALQRVKYMKSERTSGLKTTSRIFGYSPRNTLRKDFCSSTSLNQDYPKEHNIICNFGKELVEIYSKNAPEVYDSHKKTTDENVLKEWIIDKTPFTSGIINKNNRLKYHFDTGNFKDVYSCMVAFKNNIRGGYLSLPEYGIGLEIANNSVLLFDGQNILHGVTGMKDLAKDSYRYTVVYYSLKQMWNCLTVDEEIARIRNLRTKREEKRANK